MLPSVKRKRALVFIQYLHVTVPLSGVRSEGPKYRTRHIVKGIKLCNVLR